MRKLMLLAAAGVGYVLGTRAGRERYETIKSGFLKVKNNPTVQERTSQVTSTVATTVADVAKEQAPVVKEKLADVAHKVKPGGNGSSHDDLVEELHPDSTARQADPYPQGDLP